jgi:excisionase family DNA binding protein
MADEKKWITVAEAAEKSGYAMRTLQQLLKEGKIEGWKPGHDWFTTLEAVMAYKQQAKRGRPRKKREEDENDA